MERGKFSQITGSSLAPVTSHAPGKHRQEARGVGRASNDGGQPAKSYYELYPERKRTGPYVPKSTLVAPERLSSDQKRTSVLRDGTIRRSRSGSQLDSRREKTAGLTSRKQTAESLRPLHSLQDSTNGLGSIQRSASSTSAASSIALGRARPRTIVPEPVKSIEEIVRAHSSNLLVVPPSQRGPQRSASWTAFECSASGGQRLALKESTRQEPQSDAESDYSEGSVEQEARTILTSAPVDKLGQSMSQLSVGSIDPGTGSVRHDARRGPLDRAPSPSRLPPQLPPLPDSNSSSSVSVKRRGLTRCVQISVPGAPHLQVSFADVGLERGHPVMIFLGLGASRHLIGLYDDLATSLGLRLVCIDRWGIGRTDSITSDGRNILGWSFVVEQIADLLAIDRFSVLAHSAGAPFAAAVALLFPHRIQGPLHLLAPWTGMQQDSGYRWLRYIPDGVIKTAQAAEWRIQNWTLSKEGPRATNRTTPYLADDDRSSSRRSELEDMQRGPTPPPKQRTHRPVGPAAEQGPPTISGATGNSSGDIREDAETATRDAVDGIRPVLASEDEEWMMAEAARSSALDLLKASHAESARGLVDDLNLVLGKRPWGFGYADVRVACEVWHGSKDERIPLSSSISLTKEMRDCMLHVVEGANHSLMTNSEVVIEVFESICKHGGA